MKSARRHLLRPLTVTFLSLAAASLGLAWYCLRSPVPDIDPTTADQLAEAADRWWRDRRGDRSAWDVPEADWPTVVRRFAPKSARVSPDGVQIVVGSFFVEEWGLFVLPERSEFKPIEGSDPSYCQLKGRVYWYEIKG